MPLAAVSSTAAIGYCLRLLSPLGILLALDGLGTIIGQLQPYLYPNAQLGFVFTFSFVELLLPVWLLLRGWKIQEPTAQT